MARAKKKTTKKKTAKKAAKKAPAKKAAKKAPAKKAAKKAPAKKAAKKAPAKKAPAKKAPRRAAKKKAPKKVAAKKAPPKPVAMETDPADVPEAAANEAPKKAAAKKAPKKAAKKTAKKAAKKKTAKKAPKKAAAAEPEALVGDATDLELYKRIFGNNRKWVKTKLKNDPDYFKRLSKGQSPAVLWIGCADSRVPANEIMGLDPGDVFVHRNVANIVTNTDMNVHAVIQYAVEHLGVRHVVVCGHYGCGGVQAAMQPADLGQLNGWLREIRDVYRLHADELDAIANEKARYKRLVELNVQEQCINVIKTAFVQKQYNRNGYPLVHGWVFGLEDGILHDLHIPFRKILEKIQEIYRLD